MNSPPAQWSVSTSLEGEVGKVIGGEPKTLLCRVWPQHANDDVAQVTSDEGLTRRSPREDIGEWRSAEGTAGNGLHRSGVDAAEGAEAQGGPGSQRDPATAHPIR
jgi:hypothetical protein